LHIYYLAYKISVGNLLICYLAYKASVGNLHICYMAYKISVGNLHICYLAYKISVGSLHIRYLTYKISAGKLLHFLGNNMFILPRYKSESDVITCCTSPIPNSWGYLLIPC
jgi:hypothetical protein